MMVLKILLISSIVLQLLAAVIAIRLTRVTKYNFSWILFTVALTVMSVLRCGEYLQITGDADLRMPPDFFVWLGVCTSLCFAVGVFYVQKIFKYIAKTNLRKEVLEKRILHTILRTEEKERLRFAKELHDGLGPLLSSAKMSLSVLKSESMSDQNRELLNNTNYVLEEAIRSLREISNNLSPHTLTDFGLARAISNFVNKAVGNKIKVNYSTNLKTERFDTDVEVILYRVICELINNSLKHSKCDNINITLLYTDNMISIDYSDNGRGFNTSAVMDVGMGLSNITSRISSLKGDCKISSSSGNGMRAAITVKLNNDGYKRA